MTNDELDTIMEKVGLRFGHPFSRSHLVSFAKLVENATLEMAASECEEMIMYKGGRQESAKHNDVWKAAAAIRGMKK